MIAETQSKNALVTIDIDTPSIQASLIDSSIGLKVNVSELLKYETDSATELLISWLNENKKDDWDDINQAGQLQVKFLKLREIPMTVVSLF